MTSGVVPQPGTQRPKQIQLRRTTGWRKPDDAVTIARPSPWGNPFRITKCNRVECGPEVTRWCVFLDNAEHPWHEQSRSDAHQTAVRLYREALTGGALRYTFAEVRAALAGRDLACWCNIADPCHADVLLSVAAGGDGTCLPGSN